MLKTEAIELLGGSIPAVAEAIGVTYQAVDKWPDELPPRITDRVQAALWRRAQGLDTRPAPSEQEG
jgi:transcriptional repressor of cell division inhibition gene dicB